MNVRNRHGLAFGAVTYAFAVTMLGTTLPTPLYVIYKERFGLSELIITVIFVTYAAGVIAALLLFGSLSDQIGRRPVLLLGLAFSALSAVAFLLATELGLLLVGRMLSGFSAGIFTGTATATLVDLAPRKRRGRATLVATMANMGGLGCGPLLAGVVSQYGPAPLRLTFWIDLGLLVPAAAGILRMPEPVTVAARAAGRSGVELLCRRLCGDLAAGDRRGRARAACRATQRRTRICRRRCRARSDRARAAGAAAAGGWIAGRPTFWRTGPRGAW